MHVFKKKNPHCIAALLCFDTSGNRITSNEFNSTCVYHMALFALYLCWISSGFEGTSFCSRGEAECDIISCDSRHYVYNRLINVKFNRLNAYYIFGSCTRVQHRDVWMPHWISKLTDFLNRVILFLSIPIFIVRKSLNQFISFKTSTEIKKKHKRHL